MKTIILRLIILTLFALSANADDTENATAFEERKFSLCAREEKVKLC